MPQPRLVDRVEVCRVDVADVVASQARFAVYRYMGLRRSFSSGNDGDRHGAQARDQDVNSQDYDRVTPRPGKARIPDVASEWLHRLLGVCCHHARWQRSSLPRIELRRKRRRHLASAAVKQAQPFSD
jgi:hypothetical protein